MKSRWAQYLLWTMISIAGTSLILTSCGQDGSLYLPDKEQSENQDN